VEHACTLYASIPKIYKYFGKKLYFNKGIGQVLVHITKKVSLSKYIVILGVNSVSNLKGADG